MKRSPSSVMLIQRLIFCGYLEVLPDTTGMFMGNANIVPRQPRTYLYHAYLVYMEANGYKNTLSLTMFGKGLPLMLKEYGLQYEKRRPIRECRPIWHSERKAMLTGYLSAMAQQPINV